jgi:hypothetical protein
MRFCGTEMRLMVALFALAAIVAGCSFENWDYSWKHHGIGTGYDGNLSFTRIVPGQNIDPRSGHASVIFQNGIWIFGGYDPNVRGDKSPYLSDVWHSEDGRTWTPVTDAAPWKGRRGHQVIVFKDQLYLIGGYRVYVKDGISYGGAVNDVWRSADGITWEEIKPSSYRTRVTHPSLPAEEDVRGTDLYDPADDLDWYPRLNHGVAVLDPDGAGPEPEMLALFGGFAKERMPYLNDGYVGSNADETRKYFADMWTSEDGISWTQREPITLGGADAELYGTYRAGRAAFAQFVHDGALYLSGGTSWFNFSDTGQDFVVPSWDRFWRRTEAGWTASGPTNYQYSERRGHRIVDYEGEYWILPGCKPAAIQWYSGADTIWKIAVNDADGSIAAVTPDGDPSKGTPMYGIADYTAEVFTPAVGPDAGKTAIYVIFGDGDGGVRNTLWRIVKKEGAI